MGFETEATPTEKSKQKPKSQPKKEIVIPFVKIADEAFLIKGRNGESMCVTACDGELNPPFISAKGINWLKNNFDSNELDIFVDTYAKCGTTVAIKMIYKILEAEGVLPPSKTSLNSPWTAVPWIEVEASQQMVNSPSPNDFLSLIEQSQKTGARRIWKSHQPNNNLPARTLGENSKVLHVIRNPKDVVCSYYDFFRQEPMVNYQGSFDTLLDWFCDGSLVHSSFFEFELNWQRALQSGRLSEKQLLIVEYEQIVRSPQTVIAKVAKWLGFEGFTQSKVESVAEAISFAKSKKEAQANSDTAVIVNKGKIGRWKQILSQEQSDRMDRIANARLKDSGIHFTYE